MELAAPTTLLKTRHWHRCFPVNFGNFLEHLFYRHTGIPGFWTQELDAELWTLDSGRWTLSLTVVEQNQNPVGDFAD